MRKAKTYLAAAVVAIASPAVAGEITGTGEQTPIESGGVASSSCAYSGLNDNGAGPSTLVQSYGMIVSAFGQPSPGIPGTACRGNL